MIASEDNIAFPAVVKDGQVVYGCLDMEMLTFCFPGAIKAGRPVIGMKIFGADSRVFEIRSVVKYTRRKPWWKPPLFLTFLTATFDIQESGNVSLLEVKEMARDAFKADRISWEARWGYKEFVKLLDRCGTIADVAKLLR